MRKRSGAARFKQAKAERVRFLYTNWRGETAWRVVRPGALYFGQNEWHPKPQWLFDAWDEEKGAVRTFAMQNVQHWGPAEEPT